MNFQGKLEDNKAQFIEWLNNTIAETYDIAVKSGFHEKQLSDEHWIMMVITEVCELIEADRKSLTDVVCNPGSIAILDGKSNVAFTKLFRRCVKDTVADEMADIVIRLCDFAGVHGMKLNERDFDGIRVWFKKSTELWTTTELAYSFIDMIVHRQPHSTGFRYRNYWLDFLPDFIFNIFEWADQYGIDLCAQVRWKMRYNRLRAYKHGRKY